MIAEWQDESLAYWGRWRLVHQESGEVLARVEQFSTGTWKTCVSGCEQREFLTLEQAQRAVEYRLCLAFSTNLSPPLPKSTAETTAGAEIGPEGGSAQAVESLGGADERT